MTELVISRTDYATGKSQQSTITNINPNVANSTLKTFAQMTAALSKDSFAKATRVVKTELF